MSDSAANSASLSARPFQMLVRIARHSRIGDPQGCAAVFALLETGRQLQAHFHEVLARHKLAETGFTVLVSLYATDPAPASMGELAADVRIPVDALFVELETLEANGWISRDTAVSAQHGVSAQLTARGRALTEDAVRPFLVAVCRCGEALTPGQSHTLDQACINLRNKLPTRTS
jgi:DNA-binding MarR family transcriptional regulator